MELGEIYILCVRVIYMLVIPACVCVLHYKKPLLFKGLWRKIIFAAIYSCISYITLLFALCIPRAGNCFRVILWLALFVDCFHSGLVRVLACPKTKIKIPKPWGFFRILFSGNFINLKVFARFRQPLKFVAPGQIRPLFARNES